MDGTRIDVGYFDRLCLEYGKGRKNSVSSTVHHNWIDKYFYSIQLRTDSRKQLKYPRSEIIKKESIDLEVSFKMFFQEASCVADKWTDVNRKYDDRRSFPRFLGLLKLSGLDNYAFSNQPTRWLPLPDDVVFADKYYGGSLSLIQLLQRIRSESGNDDFRREQAKLLESFLDNLIKIHDEQRLVAYSFSEHLEQLRKSGAVSSNAVDDDGDRHKCSVIVSDHPTVWIQKHVFDSLYIMSRESAWLLEQLKDSRFTSASSKEESNKILDIILDFISKFEESKESFDIQNPGRELVMMQNNEIIYDFGERIKNLQEQGVERKSVAETLLGRFVDVLNIFYKRNMLSKEETSSSLQCESFSEAAKETSELINEAVEKLMSVSCSDLTGGGSPLGCIVLWRILFESSLINLRLDLIYQKHRETINLKGKQLDAASTNNNLDQIRLSIDKLLIVGESVLGEFVAMQKTVAEVTDMLGDAFITGGAGMRGSSYPGTSSKLDDQVIMYFNVDDFPWDKHTVPVLVPYTPHRDDQSVFSCLPP